MGEPIPGVKKREPIAAIQGLVVPALMGLSLFFGLSTDVQSALDAVLLAAGGAIAMLGVEWRAALPLLSGLAKAVFALIAGLGLDLAPNIQVATMTLISVAVSYYTQSQVTAKPAASSVFRDAA